MHTSHEDDNIWGFVAPQKFKSPALENEKCNTAFIVKVVMLVCVGNRTNHLGVASAMLCQIILLFNEYCEFGRTIVFAFCYILEKHAYGMQL